MTTQSIEYKEIQETLEISTDNSEISYTAAFTLSFTKLGLHEGGTFVFEDCPSGEELSLVEYHKAEWAVQDRFEEFAEQVSCWTELRRYINLTKDHNEICEALDFMQTYGAPKIAPQNLLLIQSFIAWQQQQALFLAVREVPLNPKPTMKI
tara:strand:- start:1783 stop:2235 length:453 start_codon:yes stop_codon:yes gene_type:complete